MSKKGTSPALYELIQGRIGARLQPPATDGEPGTPPPAPLAESGRLFAAGRVVRVPIGYFFVIAAVAIVLVIGAFSFGFGRGREAAQLEHSQQLADTILMESMARNVDDPLRGGAGGAGDGSSAVPASPDQASRPGEGASAAPEGPAAATGPAAIESDPRERGVNYFVIATYGPDKALELASFCRARGVEAYVIPHNNERFRQVVVLPGFRRGGRSSEPIRRLEQRLVDVGRQWEKAGRGHDNLGGKYPDLYEG